MTLTDYFQRVFVINLDRRPERWTQFQEKLPSDWPFHPPQRIRAIDGNSVYPPTWWKAGRGAWGCYRSHVYVLEQCLLDQVESALILEDDAVFCENFAARVGRFLRKVPRDWQMLYLGGQHLKSAIAAPRKINDGVYQPFNVNRTHAFAVHGKPFIQKLYQFLHSWNCWRDNDHVDHHLGRLHERRTHKIYAPKEWLVGQDAGESDICAKKVEQRYWPSAAQSLRSVQEHSGFVGILGLHSSGSSAMAGLLHHLDIHLGNQLGGYYGSNPEELCGFEDVCLARICEDAIPFPSTKFICDREEIAIRLKRWSDARRKEALQKNGWAGGKYPLLCRLGSCLAEAVGPELKVIHINRDLEESIASLIRRCSDQNPTRLAAHQKWLWKGKNHFLSTLADENRLDVEYSELLKSPKKVIRKVQSFLEIEPTTKQITNAARYVIPKRQHA